MPVVQVSQKGHILIPKRIRKKYSLTPGGQVQILEEPDGILIKPAPKDPIESAWGFLEGDFSLTDDLLEEHRKEQAHETAHRAR
ncbi:MAG: AbrB/MazE/SpoVT family DNA-binding domain-containing protein [Thermodesulfobacteriota bacterium]